MPWHVRRDAPADDGSVGGAAGPPPLRRRSDALTLISLDGIAVTLGRTSVLSDVSLAIGRGEIVTVIGPNGAGKTTLARVVLGLVAPSAGRVTRAPGLTIGYAPQRLVVDDTLPLTVGRLMTLTRPQPRRAVAAALAEVGVPDIAGRPVQGLSGGELQRVLLARALLRAPDLLVLDEPVQNVDINGQADLYGLIARIRDRRGCSVLLISHDLHVVMAATDRVLCLNRHVCCSGTPEAVTRHPAYLALFGPRAAGHVAVYSHDHGHRHAPDGTVLPLDRTAAGTAEPPAGGE